MEDTNLKQETDFAALVGIDWADQKHAWAMQIPGQREVERGDLDHTPEAVEFWAAELARSIRRPPDRGGTRAIAWIPAVHAHQVCAPGAVSREPSHPGQLP
jgi:hypothetical protein